VTPSGGSNTKSRGLPLYIADEDAMWWVRYDKGVTARHACREVGALAGLPIASLAARRVRADVGEEGGEPRIWPTEDGTEAYYEVTHVA
jgi:hypothetical protein